MTATDNSKKKGFLMPYLDQRFEAAMAALVGEGSAKDRLTAAYSEHLEDLKNDELPEAMRTRFEDLHKALHAVTPIGREPCIKATIRKMSTRQIGSHAKTIVSLYAELVCHGERTKLVSDVRGKHDKGPKFIIQGVSPLA